MLKNKKNVLLNTSTGKILIWSSALTNDINAFTIATPLIKLHCLKLITNSCNSGNIAKTTVLQCLSSFQCMFPNRDSCSAGFWASDSVRVGRTARILSLGIWNRLLPPPDARTWTCERIVSRSEAQMVEHNGYRVWINLYRGSSTRRTVTDLLLYNNGKWNLKETKWNAIGLSYKQFKHKRQEEGPKSVEMLSGAFWRDKRHVHESWW